MSDPNPMHADYRQTTADIANAQLDEERAQAQAEPNLSDETLAYLRELRASEDPSAHWEANNLEEAEQWFERPGAELEAYAEKAEREAEDDADGL